MDGRAFHYINYILYTLEEFSPLRGHSHSCRCRSVIFRAKGRAMLAPLHICLACSSIIFQLVSPARVPVELGACLTSCACWIAVGLATLRAFLSVLQLRRTAILRLIHFTDFLRDPLDVSSSAEAHLKSKLMFHTRAFAFASTWFLSCSRLSACADDAAAWRE